MRNIFLILVMLISFIFPQDCKEQINVWFKVSNDIESEAYGEVIQIDMSQGYAFFNDLYIYIVVLDKNNNEEIVISFPIGYWRVNDKIEKEFKSLEDYIKNRPSFKIAN